MSFARFQSKVFFRRLGHVDADSGDVSTTHSSCNYGCAVIVIGNVAFGPADVEGGKVQAFGEQAELLRKSGFSVVENIKE